MTKKSLPVFVLVVLLAVVGLTASSCDDQTEWEKRTKQALWANQKSWHDIQDVVAKLYHDGDITDAEFEEALESQSEFRIRAAQGRLEAVWRWVARGTEVVRAIIRDDTQDLSTLAAAQQVAYAQARMLHLAGTFQRRLAQLATAEHSRTAAEGFRF